MTILDIEKHVRPPYVAADFGGQCRIFPAPTKDGREPLLIKYQADWAKDESRLKGAEKSRQIGWSWTAAYRSVRTTSLDSARLDTWISSRDEIQARLFLVDCKAFASILQAGAQDLGERVIDEKGHTAYALSFANGLHINSMSSNPDAQAGKRGPRVLDEFALHPDPRKLYSIAYPGITWGGSLEFFSTHRGTANFFNQLILEARHKGNPKKLSLHRVTLQDALEQGLLYKLQTKLPPEDERQQMDEAEYFDFIRAGCADEETFLQEYMCVPSDDASAFLSYELLDGCKLTGANNLRITSEKHGKGTIRTLGSFEDLAACQGEIFSGLDIARVGDLTVLWAGVKIAGTYFPKLIVEMHNIEFARQEFEYWRVLALANHRRNCADQSGIGRQMVERAQKQFGEYRVEGINFTPATKEELAYPVRAAFEDRTTRIPDDTRTVAAHRAIRKETTASGNVRFAADAGPNGHADHFWAHALFLHAGKTSSGAFEFDSAVDEERDGTFTRGDLRDDTHSSGRLATL